MAVFTKQTSGRKRTKNFDLEAKRRARRGGIKTVFSPKNLGATVVSALFWLGQVLLVCAGVPALDRASTAGVALLLLVVNLLFGWYLSLHHRPLLRDRKQLVLLQSVTLFVLALTKIFVVLGWPVLLIPLGIFSVGLSVGLGQRLATLWTAGAAFVIALVSGLERAGPAGPLGVDLPLGLTLATGAMVAVFTLKRVSHRRKVIAAGIYCGLALAAMVFVTQGLLLGQTQLLSELRHSPRTILLPMAFGFLNGLFTGYFLVEFGLRFVEAAFDVVTDLRLQELADLNQPILKRFALEAPGTFHHSQMVGTLAEAAAESIGANALLCRVGAHFHDIGKMAKPEYFIENIRGPSKHAQLTPTMSTLIIIGHVKDGIEIAEELDLPSRVIDFIPEHHGTIAVEYFYHQASKQQEEKGGPPVSRDDFRYPGPRPRSRETAILMIADSIEAISRVLDNPNPARVEGVVHDVVMRRMQEGQFDRCGITLRELADVEMAMVRVLLGAHHGRIKYPKPAADELVALQEADPRSRLKLAHELADGPGVPSVAALGPPERDGGLAAEPTERVPSGRHRNLRVPEKDQTARMAAVRARSDPKET